MSIERVRKGGTRARYKLAFGQPRLLAVMVLGATVFGGSLWVPRTTRPGSDSAVDAALTSGSASESRPPVATEPNLVRRSPLSIEEVLALFDAQAAKPRFDGTLHDWRIAPYEALEAAGIGGRGLSRSCQPYEAGAEMRTQLDFTVGYLPPDFAVGPVTGPFKWLCANEALSVLSIYHGDTLLGAGTIWIDRSIRGRQTIEADVPVDSVEATTINGRPAIVFHPADDATGLGIGRVVVLEGLDGPDFAILSITADNGVPFHELIRIAEGIK